MLNKQVYEEKISAEQYKQALKGIDKTYSYKAGIESEGRRRTSVTQATSTAIKEREARDIAASKGQGIGTITGPVPSSSELARQTEVGQIQGSAQILKSQIKTGTTDQPIQARQPDPSLVSSYLKQGTINNPITGKQPDQSLVSPYIKSKETAPKFDAIIGSVAAPIGVQLVKDTGLKPIPPEQKGKLQDYPRYLSNDPITGFYEGFLKPLTEVIIAPKPIITDILGPTPEDLRFRKKIIEKQKETIRSGPTFTGSVIEDVSKGKFPEGTGVGFWYDVGSFTGDVLLALTPAKKIPVPVKIAKIGSDKIIVAGLGSKIKPIATVTGSKITKGYDVTKMGKEGFKDIGESFNIKAKGGAEFDALGNLESQIITSEKNLVKLQSAGILTSENVRLIQAGKTVVKESAKLPNKVLRDLGEQPFEKIKPGKETKAVKEFFKEEKITLEGSAIDIPTFLERFVGRAGDFDVKVKSFIQAKELAKKAAVRLTKSAEGTERKFKAVGSKVEVFERGKSLGKVGEFLSVDDPQAAGQIAKTNKVFGVKTDTGKMTVEGIKMKTAKFQINRRIASITSIQPTKKGITIGPPINPPGLGTTRAKDFPRAYAGALTRAWIAKEKGQFARAERLEQAAKDIKEIGSKDIDFDEFFKSRKYETTKLIQEEKPSLIKDFSTQISERPQTGSILKNLQPEKDSPQSPRGTSIINKQSQINKSLSPYRPASSVSKYQPRPATRPASSYSKSKTDSFRKSANRVLNSIGPSVGPSKGPSIISPGISSPGSPGSSTGKGGTPKGSSLASLSSLSSATRATILTEQKRIAAIPIWKTRIDQPRKEPPRPIHDFLGFAHEESILGVRTTRKDIDVGDKRIRKLAREDIKSTRKKRTKSLNKMTKSLMGLGKTKPSLF